jgi:cation:H+ antiporter
MLIQFLLVSVGVLLVTYGAKYLVAGASALAARLGVSDLVVGLTVVAFGTSAPELVVSITAAGSGQADVALGNVIGSNMLNICLILGLSALIAPLRVQDNTAWKEIPFSLLGIVVVFLMAHDAWLDGAPSSAISRIDGLVLLGFFLVYLYYTFELARNTSQPDADTSGNKSLRIHWAVLMVVGGVLGLTFGGQFIVDASIAIARVLGVSEAVIGLTLVAIGTSIPELATSIVAARAGNADIAVGNVVGSNIFNVFLILGASATIAPLPPGNITMMDFGVCMLATVLLFVFSLSNRPPLISRGKGAIFILVYVVFLVNLLLKI